MPAFPLLLAAVLAVSVVAVNVVAAPKPSQAKAEDRTLGTLNTARTRFEEAMEGVRATIEKALHSALDAAPKAKDSAAALKSAREQIAGFSARGELPDHPNRARWETSAVNATADLQSAYNKAIAEFIKAKNDAMVSLLTAEADQFKASWELVPWGVNLVSSKTESERTITPGITVDVPLDTPGKYRLEVKMRAIDDASVLTLGLPLGKHGALSLPVSPGKQKKQWIVLTVAEDKVFADLGAQRPIRLDTLREQHGARLTLSASGGGLVIESVRTKPLVRPLTAADLMPERSVWRGPVQHSERKDFMVRYEVRSVQDDKIVMVGSWVETVQLELVFGYSGCDLTLISARPVGASGGTRSETKGTGRVSGNVMTSTWSWLNTYGSRKNVPVHGSIRFERE